MDKRHMLHVTMYCSAISPCGRYLAVGNNFGYISLLNLAQSLYSKEAEINQKPFCSFKAHLGPIHAMKTVAKLLISAGSGHIACWKWSDIISNKISKSLTLNRDATSQIRSECEMYNCLSSKDNILYSGDDSSLVLAWDLKTGKNIETFADHKEYIHDIDMTSNSLVSASEDGFVKVWDTRSVQCVQSYEPHKTSKLYRPQAGRWLSCVAVDANGQWMVCGGGPKTSLWHLRSKNFIATLPDTTEVLNKNLFSPNTITFQDDEIIAGGNQPNVYRWYVNGESKAVVPCSIKNVFSISFKPSLNQEERELPMVITGNSPCIDLFTNLGYLGTTMSVV